MVAPVRFSNGFSCDEHMFTRVEEDLCSQTSSVDEQQRQLDDYIRSIEDEGEYIDALLDECNQKNEGEEYEGAAREGNIAILKKAKTNGALTAAMCQEAAEAGQIYVLQWLHANGCPWDEMTCAGAALGGNLEVLQWARANGCPWDEKTYKYAAMRVHTEVLQWIRANGCPNYDERILVLGRLSI